MELYTSYFAKVKQLKEMGYDNLVCVAGYAPKFYFNTPKARFYPDLAPKKLWWQYWHDNHLPNMFYVEQYNNTVLSKLDPNEVVRNLGDGAVMLCYEKPGEFCHRHLVADWIVKNTGVEVEEIQL